MISAPQSQTSSPADTLLLTTLSQLLEYPGEHVLDLASRARATIEERCPAALPTFERFATEFTALSRESREELATGTFEITPLVVPYVSVHLFGEENFKRGEFMAAISAQCAQRGFDPRGELPDHIAVLLRYAAELDCAEQRELLRFCILGPLNKMIASLDQSNPYQALLETARVILRSAHPDLEPALSPLEQMRTQDGGCATVSAGCHCGPSDQSIDSTLQPQQSAWNSTL